MLKMEYFDFRLLLGVLRSKQLSGRWWHHCVYSVNVRGSFKLSTGQGTVLYPGAVMPQVTLLSVDTNSLRHLPRRSSKNCDLPFVNIDSRT